MRDAGLIEKRAIEQAYDPVKEIFLPDRFIKGECPKCGAKDQYGDNCEKCGATYSPTDLKNPFSVVSGATPIKKISDHFFFKLSDPRCEAFLREWTQVKTPLQSEARNKMKEWVGEPGDSKLGDWDISRDAPYFGFEIPDAPGKYFYVWLDAPIGYYASFLNYCQTKGLNFDEWVKPDTTTEQYHFIGKDILYFHTLFWPATLQFAGYRTPTNVFAHGFLTVDGEKMSKSLGNSLQVMEVLKRVRGIELRYYLGSAHYRSMLEFSFEALEESATSFRRIENFMIRATELIGSIPEAEISREFREAMNDDLAVPEGLALISEWVRAGNSALSNGDSVETERFARYIRGALEILGCDPYDPTFATSNSKKLDSAIDGLIALLLEQREAARARRDFAGADAIRDRIAAMGISIEDTPAGPRWSVN